MDTSRKNHVESVLEFADNGVALWPRFLDSRISVTFLITRRTDTCLIKFIDKVKNVEA